MANEKRLIDANKFGTYLADVQLANRGWKDDICEFLDDVMFVLDEQPTVDAVEVVHGRWEKAEYNGFLRCDQCKDVYINEEWLEDGKWNYCPNCGSRMDGDGNG